MSEKEALEAFQNGDSLTTSEYLKEVQGRTDADKMMEKAMDALDALADAESKHLTVTEDGLGSAGYRGIFG